MSRNIGKNGEKRGDDLDILDWYLKDNGKKTET